MDAGRRAVPAGRAAARGLLERVVTLALSAFPHQILPNKLLQEVRALAGAAGLRLPLVDEVATDIFMGTFSEKYLRAAQRAAGMLEGTLYARYYGIDYAAVRAIDDVQPSRYGPPTSPAFGRLCHDRAGLRDKPSGQWRGVAENGAVIEQEQVLTTHNLAVLTEALELAEALSGQLEDLAQRCFTWVCDEIERLRGPRWGQLRTVKNTAYGWRQMVFYLSLMPREDIDAFIRWAADHLGDRPLPLQERFKPMLAGLASATGVPTEDLFGHSVRAAGPFYGWTTTGHALLIEAPRTSTA